MTVLPELWSNLAALSERLGRWGQRELDELKAVEGIARGKLLDWASSPEVMRAAFAVLRAHHPILLVGDKALVTRYPDVLEVLGRDEFGVTETYAGKMARTTGDFFLGMENTPRYHRESSFARRGVRPGDLDLIQSLAAVRTDALLEQVRPFGQLEVVNGLARLVPLAIVDEYFGVPGPDLETMKRWMRAVFWHLFLNLPDDPRVAARAESAASELNAYLEGLIAARKRELATSSRDDFLTRLLKQQAAQPDFLDDGGVRRNVGGIIVGAVDTASKTIIHALDELFRHPAMMANARRAAVAGDGAAVAAYVFEALRFNPHNPILLRTCHRDCVLAAGTERERLIPKGTLVCAATLSAMFDEDTLEAPGEFRVDRPAAHYLHFGYGQHTCFGERIMQRVVPEVLERVLRLDNLRRAEGEDGEVRHEGPFPDRFVIEFDPE